RSYYSKHNAVFTTSSLNGVQKLASSNKPNPTKNMSSYFFGLYLLLDAGQLFHNLIGFHFLFFS
ncbi:hypothetical protein, partial [Enterococcus faecium]|uniref:hypothetical protein n=1 Tax=Enterococcus faecium TaxID=1352 RepID=UPI000CF1D0C1